MNFDEASPEYSRLVDAAVGFSGRPQAFFLDVKAEALLSILRRRCGSAGLHGRRVLEVGCGRGLMQERLRAGGADVWGIDTSLPSLAAARRSLRDRVIAADGFQAPWPDASFDMTTAVCVFHHVAPARRGELVREMARVTRPGGVVAICEHNPWNPLTRRAVHHCPFDHDAILLSLPEARRHLAGAGLVQCSSRYLIFSPWRTAPWRWLETLFSGLPLGAQYAAIAVRR